MTDSRIAKLVAQMRVLEKASGIPLPPGRTFQHIAQTTLKGCEQAGLVVIDPEDPATIDRLARFLRNQPEYLDEPATVGSWSWNAATQVLKVLADGR